MIKGSTIRAHRTSRRLTQKILSEAAGISTTTISMLERDDYNPSLQVMENIAIALDMTLVVCLIEKDQDVKIVSKR